MKKLLGIVVLGLLLSGCDIYTQTPKQKFGYNFSALTKGMSKQKVSYEYLAVILPSNPFQGSCSYKYYPDRQAEILSSEDNTNHLIFDSKIKSGECNDSEGTFHSIHNTFASAENAMKNIVKNLAEKKQEDLTFTINDKKEQCEAIGFTPQTEKFADCVLRLVELDIKSQQQKQIELALSQGNQQLANELKAQRNQQGGQYLMDLGQKLLTPTAPASLPTTKNCTVRGTGVYKTVTCW